MCENCSQNSSTPLLTQWPFASKWPHDLLGHPRITFDLPFLHQRLKLSRYQESTAQSLFFTTSAVSLPSPLYRVIWFVFSIIYNTACFNFFTILPPPPPGYFCSTLTLEFMLLFCFVLFLVCCCFGLFCFGIFPWELGSNWVIPILRCLAGIPWLFGCGWHFLSLHRRSLMARVQHLHPSLWMTQCTPALSHLHHRSVLCNS